VETRMTTSRSSNWPAWPSRWAVSGSSLAKRAAIATAGALRRQPGATRLSGHPQLTDQREHLSLCDCRSRYPPCRWWRPAPCFVQGSSSMPVMPSSGWQRSIAVFDKTGTLTLPEPRVDNAADVDPAMLETAARLALSSRHPLAAAVAREAKNRAPFEGAMEVPGRGVRAFVDGDEARLGSPAFCGLAAADSAAAPESGTSLIALTHKGRSALLSIRQQLRPDAKRVVTALQARGHRIVILSGDRPGAVAPIARALGVADWSAGLTPIEKIAFIDQLNAQGRRALMVGDGLNDAPSLAAAHVSLSPISATELTQAQADGVFLGELLTRHERARLSCTHGARARAHRARCLPVVDPRPAIR
jgi:soluble P-type ATPase